MAKARRKAKGPATLPGTISGATADDAAKFLESMYAARAEYWAKKMGAQLSLDEELMGAEFSVCRTWRYALWRLWDDRKACAFIGLNPSTADETADDPTIRRCIRFARDFGCGGLYMLNLFAFRATDPKVMMRAGSLGTDPIGLGNNAAILKYAGQSKLIIAAWGIHGHLGGRDDQVRRLLRLHDYELRCLGKTKDGFPKHPLYVPAATLAQVYS